MLKYHFAAHHCTITPEDQAALDRHVERIEALLPHVDPDLVHLSVVIDWQLRPDECVGDIRLVVMNHAMPAKRNHAPTVQVLLKNAFEDIEQQLERFLAGLRRDTAHERRLAAQSRDEIRFRQPELLEDVALLDRLHAGDRAAFDELVELELPKLRSIIVGAFAEQGESVDDPVVDQTLAQTLEAAFRELSDKPSDWALGGWLAWIARRQIRGETQESSVP